MQRTKTILINFIVQSTVRHLSHKEHASSSYGPFNPWNLGPMLDFHECPNLRIEVIHDQGPIVPNCSSKMPGINA